MIEFYVMNGTRRD